MMDQIGTLRRSFEERVAFEEKKETTALKSKASRINKAVLEVATDLAVRIVAGVIMSVLLDQIHTTEDANACSENSEVDGQGSDTDEQA